MTTKSSRARAKERVHELVELLTKYNEAYYLQDKPLVNDATWDKFFRELEALEQEFPDLQLPYSPTQRVGAAPQGAFQNLATINPCSAWPMR